MESSLSPRIVSRSWSASVTYIFSSFSKGKVRTFEVRNSREITRRDSRKRQLLELDSLALDTDKHTRLQSFFAFLDHF
jgi:hypothetical protein